MPSAGSPPDRAVQRAASTARTGSATLWTMLRGFKDFVMRGNVVELAVAVVIATAFGLVVSAFTEKIVNPLINAITPPGSFGLGVQLVAGKPSTYVDFAALISAAVNFLLVAAVVYVLIVVPMARLAERRAGGEAPGSAVPTELEVLQEIRDLLRERSA